MAELLFDFDNPADAKRSLKRVAQAMLRAGQPVVSSDFDQKVRRTSGVSYRQAMLTLASGQTVGLMIKLTGDVYRVMLNGTVLPIKNQDGLKAIAEIAAAAERNQAKFQKAQARKLVELPKSIRTAAPRMEQVLQQRNTELDAQIAERTAERDALKAELGDQALDSVELKPLTDEYDAALQLAVGVGEGVSLDGVADLAGALSSLKIALDIAEHNAPINEAAGNVEQAALERENAASFRWAIDLLDDVSSSEHPARADRNDRSKPEWDSHTWPQVFQASDGKWFGVREGWDLQAHIGDDWKEGRTVSLLREDGGFIKYGEPNKDWENSLEQRPDALDSTPEAELSGAALEVLEQIAEGPVEDGDVISKAARDELVDAGLIDRYTDAGDNVINDAGLAYLAERDAPSDDQASLFDDTESDDGAAAHEGQESLLGA